MANDKKKTESANDAAPSSGAQSTPPASVAPTATSGSAPTARELELQAQVNELRSEIDFLRSGGPDLEPGGKMAALIDKLGESIGVGVAKALRAEREGQQAVKKAPKREVPPEFKGPKTYIVGPKGAYQGNRRFVQGERITVVDQFPASDWTPVEQADSAPTPQAAAPKQGRASDRHVG